MQKSVQIMSEIQHSPNEESRGLFLLTITGKRTMVKQKHAQIEECTMMQQSMIVQRMRSAKMAFAFISEPSENTH